jgi:N-acetyl-gamma-glutamyl-phosphate reductase
VHKIPVGILGASGYAGRELCSIVDRHPRLRLAFATANAQRGERTRIGASEVTFVAPEDARLADAELIFSALPHGSSAQWIRRAADAGVRGVDLSADLRPGNGSQTAAPYGLTEITRPLLRDAHMIANPGCYPTAVLIALIPFAARGMLTPGSTITINAASGVTGAGFTPRPDLLFAEVAEDFKAYAVGNEHRHLAEMRAVLDGYNADVDLLFTPHLLPVARGILATITVPLTEMPADPLAPLREHYHNERFVEVADEPPTLRDVVRRNVVRVSARVASGVRQPTLIVISAIDNLVKGAAGQAVQNANLALGLDEALGLVA